MKHEMTVPLTLFGMPVRIIPAAALPPVLQISPDFPHVSPEFRASWNAWALERFGRENRILILQFGPRKVCCMTEETERMLRAGVDRLAEDMVRGRDFQLGELRRALRPVGLVNPRSIAMAKNFT